MSEATGIFIERGVGGLKRFCSRAHDASGLDADRLFAIATAALRRHKGMSFSYDDLGPILELESRWYESLTSGKPDFDVYAEPYYFADLWVCWRAYSSGYMRAMLKETKVLDVPVVDLIDSCERVIDLGCGVGYTTTALAEMFPNSSVIGTNVEGTAQFKMAEAMGKLFGFTVGSFPARRPNDLLVASEYFEHFRDPVAHLKEVVERYWPRWMVIANTFNSPGIGHFRSYDHEDRMVPGVTISRLFGAALRDLGYEPVKTGWWNNRPGLWRQR